MVENVSGSQEVMLVTDPSPVTEAPSEDVEPPLPDVIVAVLSPVCEV